MAAEFKETIKVCLAIISSKINFLSKFTRKVASSR